MLRFYYNGSPNPTKVALLLEELGLTVDGCLRAARQLVARSS